MCRFKLFYFSFDLISMMIVWFVDGWWIVEHVQDINDSSLWCFWIQTEFWKSSPASPESMDAFDVKMNFGKVVPPRPVPLVPP